MAELGWSIGEGVEEPLRTVPAAIGAWKVEGELGRGGGGVVYRARPVEGGAPVAIKTLLRFAPERLRERLLREGELAARLDHPGIVRLLERGEEDGRPYLVYELVEEARALSDALPELGADQGARAVLELARAVAHAHERGVVHRDLKPENVLLERGQPRLIDFGVGGADDLDRLTITGGLVGTPHHMPPEQLTGDRARQGPASDVWSLGTILFQALSGRAPWPDLPLVALREAVLSGPVPSPREVAPGVSPALEAVCQRALAREPAQRFPHAGAFAQALEAALAGRTPRRRAGLLPLLAGSACALVGVLGAWAGLRPDPGAASGPPQAGATETPPAADPEGAWRAALETAEPQRQAALRAWLEEHPGHARADEARQALTALAARLPLAVLGPWEGRARAAFLEDGTLLCAGGAARGWARHLTPEGRELAVWQLPAAATALAANARQAVVSGPELAPTLLEPGRADARRLGFEPSPLLALDPAGQRLALGRHGAVELRDLGGAPPLLLPVVGDFPAALGFAEGGALLLAGVAPGQQLELSYLAVWQVQDGRELARQSSYDVPVCLGVGPGVLAMGDAFGHVLLVSPRGGREAIPADDPALPTPETGFRPRSHLGAVRGLAFAPDGQRLYSLAVSPVRGGYQLRAWDARTGALLRTWPEQGAAPASLAISPAGDLLAVGTEAGTLELWLLLH